jgi:alpha-glucosidase
MTFTNNDWWRDAVIYQIYPRSFSDANGDGNGDLQGVIDRLDYLQALGVDALWLSPFYPSPLADGGYDVADYCDVDPRLGTLDQFDELVAKAHERGIGIIVDIVPNHTSDQHRWFQEALAQGPESEAAQRYVFRQGKGEHGELPPTNWLSNFGGSAWESCGDGWYYLHLFAKEQPDLNWDNPEVRHEFLRVLTFWCDRGVDGFRIDVSHGLAKDLREPLRDRKLLLHKAEIRRLIGKVKEKGYTLVPLKMYFSHGLIKIEIALATGKKLYDKRQDMAKRDAKREVERALKERNR